MPAGHRILLVDDDTDWTETLSDMLLYWGHQVRVAEAGEQAAAVARTFRPHIAFIDLELPGISGEEVARRLRADPDLATCKLVALTGREPPRSGDGARPTDFDDYLVKPVNPQALKRLLLAP